jgi:hypothetical protein
MPSWGGGGSLQYPSNVNYPHVEYGSLKGSSNLQKNLQLHLTWKVTSINLHKNTFQKPWIQTSHVSMIILLA